MKEHVLHPVTEKEKEEMLIPEDSLSPALVDYFGNRMLLARNVSLITFLSLGWTAVFTFVNPLLTLGLKDAGMTDSQLGVQGSINAWLYSYLVMYFAWKSDKTITRFGRRIPYLFISAPVIILALILFPLSHYKWIMSGIVIVQALFMDIKAATIPLLNIDCVPRRLLGRVNAISGVIVSIVMFFSFRYFMALSDKHHSLPFFLGAGFLVLTTLSSLLIKEPPIQIAPSKEMFKPWSTLIVVWKDDPISFFLFAGVGLIQIFTVMTWAWLTLLASRDLHMSHGEIGSYSSWAIVVTIIFSFPAGWLIDRYRGMRLLYVYTGLMLFTAWYIVFHMKTPQDLMIVSILVASFGLFYNAADIKVYREADPKHVGSFTSSNSCLRGFCLGAMVMISGFIIQRTGDHYEAGFIFGAIMSFIGFLFLVLHDYLKKKKKRRLEQKQETALPVGLAGEPSS